MIKARLTRNLGLLLVGVWLIATGVIELGVRVPGIAPLLAILAIAAGVLVVLGR
jgi:ABC-type thiamin/hydroxymethylpyrimidine transport system permease subunit